jgi:hypothetical protein
VATDQEILYTLWKMSFGCKFATILEEKTAKKLLVARSLSKILFEINLALKNQIKWKSLDNFSDHLK